MFQLLQSTEVRVAGVTNRVEKHGDEDKPAVSLSLELTDANTSLDSIDPKIREALYKAVDGQEVLPGVEPSTPVLRCNAFERHTLATSYEGWTLTVEDGIDETAPMIFGSVKADKFSVEAKQGGSVVLRFRVGTSDVDADKLGKLAMHNGQAIYITLTAPKPGAEPIDGTQEAFYRDHPDAGDLFAAGGPEDGDSEGGDPDVGQGDEITGDGSGEALPEIDEQNPSAEREAGPWPFPRDAAGQEAPPQSVTVERSQPGTRTARGREKTRAALADGGILDGSNRTTPGEVEISIVGDEAAVETPETPAGVRH